MNIRIKRFLKAQAHKLKPIVQIGKQGLSESVLKEISSALCAHELIKIQFTQVLKPEVSHMLQQIEEKIQAVVISHMGHIVVLFLQKETDSKFDFGALGD